MDRLLLPALMLLGLSFTATAQSPAPAAPTGDAVRGKEIFLKVGCDQCHGREAQGSPVTGPRLGPTALPIAAFSVFLRTPRVQMPPYSATVLSDVDVADIYAYVASRPKPVAIEKLPD